MSKLGPPVLRKVLERKILGMRYSNPTIKAYFEKKHSEGKRCKIVQTAGAKRLARLVWMTEHRALRAQAAEPT
jgi:hypothetical protein